MNETVADLNRFAVEGDGTVTISVDTTNEWPRGGPGRPAVRLSSDNTYTHGLFILDLNHMPTGCGTWPAYWLLGPNWPYTGEIDIIEGVNTSPDNAVSLHSSPGCSITGSGQLATFETSNCDTNANGNSGCGSLLNHTKIPFNYGVDFNDNLGGVYATEWTSNYVKTWYFPRQSIPDSIANGQPDVSTFGIPDVNAQTPSGSCNIDQHFQNMSVIINTDFCGAYAGEVYSSQYPNCPQTPGAASLNSCVDYVGNNPSDFVEAYWEINSLQVYQMPVGATPSSTYSTSLSSVAPSAASTNTVQAGQGASTTGTASSAYTGPVFSGTVTTSAGAASATPAICPGSNNTRWTDFNGQQYNIACGSDMGGGGPIVSVGSFEACMEACDGLDSCSGVSFIGGNGAGTCYTKDINGTLTYDGHTNAAVLIAGAFQPPSSSSLSTTSSSSAAVSTPSSVFAISNTSSSSSSSSSSAAMASTVRFSTTQPTTRPQSATSSVASTTSSTSQTSSLLPPTSSSAPLASSTALSSETSSSAISSSSSLSSTSASSTSSSSVANMLTSSSYETTTSVSSAPTPACGSTYMDPNSTAPYEIHCSSDNSAGGIASMHSNSGGFGACFAYCDASASCQGFTFVGSEDGDCYLKSAVGTYIDVGDNYVSCFKVGSGSTSSSKSSFSSSSPPLIMSTSSGISSSKASSTSASSSGPSSVSAMSSNSASSSSTSATIMSSTTSTSQTSTAGSASPLSSSSLPMTDVPSPYPTSMSSTQSPSLSQGLVNSTTAMFPNATMSTTSTSTSALSSTSAVAPACSSSTVICATTEQQQHTCSDANGAVYGVTCGVQYTGTIVNPPPLPPSEKDKRQVPEATLQGCQQLCDNSYPQCVAINYLGTTCTMFSSVNGTTQVPGGVAASQVSPPPAPGTPAPPPVCPQAAGMSYTDSNNVMYGLGCYTNFAGNDIGTPISEPNFSQCLSYCDTMSGCYGVQYNYYYLLCYLKSSLTGQQTSNTSIIYARKGGAPPSGTSSVSTTPSVTTTLCKLFAICLKNRELTSLSFGLWSDDYHYAYSDHRLDSTSWRVVHERAQWLLLCVYDYVS